MKAGNFASEQEALQAVNEAAASDLGEALKLALGHLESDPECAEMHVVVARLLSHEGSSEDAAEHYRVALALDGEKRDPELEQWFENAAGIRLELTSSHGESLKAGVAMDEVIVEEEVAPIEPANISPLRDRRPEKRQEIPLEAEEVEADSPGEAGEADASMGDSDDDSGDDPDDDSDDDSGDGPDEEEGLTLPPPPGLQAVGLDEEELERTAMESTGTVTGHPLSTEDVKDLRAEHVSHAKEKVSAVMVAIVVHLVVLASLGLIVIAAPRERPPEIVAVVLPSEPVVPTVKMKEVQKAAKPSPSSAMRLDVFSVATTSNVAVPMIFDNAHNIEPIGAGGEFGMAMNFGGEGNGNVSFFGSSAKASKVVFVVDSSASMSSKGSTGISKHQLMKNELKKTIKELSLGVEFQIIFFSGPAWFVGDRVPDSRDQGDDWHQLNGKNFWHYKNGELDELPVGEYRQASPSEIRKTMREIDKTPMTYGTDWRAPLKMALVMEPDVIFFMTDGAVGKHPEKPPVVVDVIRVNKQKSRAKINSICLMVPKATDMLRQLADDSRGEFTLVLEDGTSLRGKELAKYERENSN